MMNVRVVSDRAHVVRGCTLLVGLLALTGCFTSEKPFYEEAQIIQDARVEGTYESYSTTVPGDAKKDETVWWIRANGGGRGKYDVIIRDGEVSIHLLGTLFQVEQMLFLDLYPLTDSGVRNVSPAVAVSEIVRAAFYARRHVVWKVEVSDTAVKYTAPSFKNGTFSAAKQAPELRSHLTADGILVLPGPAKESQKYLRQFANDASVFNYKGELRKKPQDAK